MGRRRSEKIWRRSVRRRRGWGGRGGWRGGKKSERELVTNSGHYRLIYGLFKAQWTLVRPKWTLVFRRETPKGLRANKSDQSMCRNTVLDMDGKVAGVAFLLPFWFLVLRIIMNDSYWSLFVRIAAEETTISLLTSGFDFSFRSKKRGKMAVADCFVTK